MGGLSIWRWLMVQLVVLLLFGSGKVSNLMGDLAKGIKAFKKNMAEEDNAGTDVWSLDPEAYITPLIDRMGSDYPSKLLDALLPWNFKMPDRQAPQKMATWLSAVDTLRHLLALHVAPADVGDREAVARLAADIQEATGDLGDLAYVDQGYTGDNAANAVAAQSITLEVVELPEAKRGFILLPRRWIVEEPLHGLRAVDGLSKIMNNNPRRSPCCMSPPPSDT